MTASPVSWLIIPPSLYLNRAALHFNSGHTADFGQHTEITLQDIPKHRLTLRLFAGNDESDLQRKDNLTWASVPPLYVICSPIAYNPSSLCVCRDISPTSKIRVEIQMKRAQLSWPKMEQGSKDINLQGLYDDYWMSNVHQLTSQGES